MRKRNRREQGFTLVEALVVLGIMGVLAGFAVIQSFGSMQSYKVNSAQDIVASQLRLTRQLAISERRDVEIQFNTAANPPTPQLHS